VEQAAPLDRCHPRDDRAGRGHARAGAGAGAAAEVDERHGAPLDAQGQRIDFWIVGMGKLGARELNVSSDIDLIYVYEDEARPDRPRTPPAPNPVRISAHEYFSLVAKRCTR
jgi:glutamate-ammonia-ligase adenylyltransferase